MRWALHHSQQPLEYELHGSLCIAQMKPRTPVKIRRIVFWQQYVSPHLAGWMRALADLTPSGETVAVFQDDMPSQRVLLGWAGGGPDYGQTKVFVRPGPEIVDALIREESERTLHVFSGTVHVPAINRAMRRCVKIGAKVGILSEGRDPRGLFGALRTAHSFLHERRYRCRTAFVLAIGNHADRWYRKCGYSPEQLFPFCYTVENTNPAGGHWSEPNSVMLTFVGQLIPRKRVDLLLRALAVVRPPGWMLRIIGDGNERKSLEKLAGDLHLTDRVNFTGGLDNIEVRKELARADILVLPSEMDGWGAVINEALMSGTAVICSDCCGAADLISNGLNGEIFKCGSAESLVTTLNRWIEKGTLASSARARIIEWSRCIEGPAIASYFLDIIQYISGEKAERPRAPWLM